MKRIDYIIIILILITWGLEDSYHLFPRSFKIQPFPLSEKIVTKWRYVHDLSTYSRFIIFAICILIRKIDLHWLTKDVIKITIGLIVFSGIWYILMYGNPYYKAELWLKFIAIGAIYISIKSIQWHARRNDRVSIR